MTPEALIDWLQSLSAMQLMLYCSLSLVAITWAGVIFVRPILWVWLRPEPRVNELVSHASGGFSLFYALLLGLLSVAAYQNSERVKQLVNVEAAGIASLYRSFAAYPEPLRSELEYLLRDYTLYVIHEDFPAHRQGRITNGGSNRLQLIALQLAEYEPGSRSREILHGEVFRGFSEVSSARHQRLAAVDIRIPGVLWYVVAIGAAITVMMLWMLNMRFRSHLLLGGIVSFFLGVMLFVILAMDRPLRSELGVDADAFRLIYDVVMREDDRAS
jgi:hypothetical protein